MGRGVDGFFNEKKTVCRDHLLSRDEAASLDVFTKHLNAFVDSLGKSVVDAVGTLVRFVGLQTEGQDEVDAMPLLCLLVYARYSPKMQYLAKCHLLDEPACETFWSKPLPYIVPPSCRSA
mmetsp:Transcript_117353/g.373933  ORF Transcript_117353/g.373933 Transcript_117353/m.373933 type:complete len:120 (+) Transcript_117353:2941-3300(+)